MTEPLPTTPGGWGVILADPAWETLTWDRVNTVPTRATDGDPYPTMSLDDLMRLEVGAVAARDCVLFMWVIDTHLDQAIALASSWGFAYRTIAFIWAKTPKHPPPGGRGEHVMGLGKWSRKQAEVCLLFTRGKPGRQKGGGGVRQIIEAPRREHSRKPNEQYQRIEALAAGPYLEMFTRKRRLGWAAWGNEINKFSGE